MKHCTNVLLLAFFICTGCHTYYKAQMMSPGDQAMRKIDSLQAKNRYFILRDSSHAWYMNHLQLNPEQTLITCTLDTLAPTHQLHLVNGIHHHRRYKKSDSLQAGVINEVHLYIQPDNTTIPGPYSLDLSQVQKIEVLEKDKKRTVNSYVLGGLGLTLGTALVVLAIAAASLDYGTGPF